MSRAVYRYRVPITDAPVLELPPSARFLSVGPPRDGQDALDLWAMVDPAEAPTARYRLYVVGTGNPVPDAAGQHIGSVTTHGGQLVWHVFEGGTL